MHAPHEKDEGDRLRRLTAVMRFLGQLPGSADERALVLSIIQAGAVWYDLDARVYRRELNGKFAIEAWLPGADVTNDPKEIDVDAVLALDAPARISSISELEQYGWQSVQGEELLFPIVVEGMVRRIVAVAGPVDRDVESTLMLMCRSAGAVLDQLAVRRGRAVHDRLTQRIASATSVFRTSVRGVIEEYLAAVDAAAARVTMAKGKQAPVTLFQSGGEMWAGEALADLAPGGAEVSSRRLAFGFALGNGAGGVVELLAAPARPFTIERAHAASVGADLLGVWLAGMSLGAVQTPAQGLQPVPEAPPFEESMRGELARGRRLSLNGGVVVASVPGAATPDPRVTSIVIRTVRAELRSADLMGQLPGGDIAAVLVRTKPEGVARAAERVRVRLDELARARQLPAVVVGHTAYPGGAGESPAALVERARKEAGLVFG